MARTDFEKLTIHEQAVVLGPCQFSDSPNTILVGARKYELASMAKTNTQIQCLLAQ